MKQFKEKVNTWINENRLLEIVITVKNVGRKTIFGRVIKLNKEENSLLIFLDDTKSVENISFNEIDDIIPADNII